MSNEIEYNNLIAFHPGSYIGDIIEELNMTQAEFAYRIDTTPKTISKIVNGEARVTTELASKLSKITGISGKTWLNLQSSYDIKVQEIKESRDADEKSVAESIDFGYFKKILKLKIKDIV
ncbi:HigA family addiction module antitoxin [Companilactobacillus furfuricola]|uniref:HigA family addiction module antitoxin n=1 Tax=Companilactobacillus furfuricola TaxID=1462575 RepID=UPI00319D8C86